VALANGIQRYLRENNRPEINFMQNNSPVFPQFQKGIDAKMKELAQVGIVKIFNTWFTYLRNSFNHDHIKKKSLKSTFSFYLFGLFK
jgi:hypothetical protein